MNKDKEIAPACIHFEEREHDVGSFLELCPIVSYTFNYTNIGEKPLVIHNIDSGCSCVKVEYTKRPILNGEKGQIKVTYNARKKYPGYFKRPIAVTANGEKERTVLYLKGYMIPATIEKEK